ncbi:MAG: hypothetical protein ACTHMJ_22975 [Thermomicrobiales bacterium]|jgi:hypothetical protein|nr:hypothetical protein [Thermomicrobiales bacterium]
MSGNATPPVDLTDLVEGVLSGPEWEAWLAANPAIAADVAIARRVRAALIELRAAPLALPPDFEARLLQRCRQSSAVLDLLDLGLAKGLQALLDLLAVFFALLPGPQPASA